MTYYDILISLITILYSKESAMEEKKLSSWFFCATYSFKTCPEVCERRRSMPSQYRKCATCTLLKSKKELKPQPEMTA